MADFRVVAACFFRQSDKGTEIALFRRRHGDIGAGVYEFPGGKVEPLETDEQALVREIQEELGLRVLNSELLGQVNHQFPQGLMDLRVYWTWVCDFQWVLNDHDDVRWVHEGNWTDFNVAEADISLLKKAFASRRLGSSA